MNKVVERCVREIYEMIKELHEQIGQDVGSNFLKELDIHIQKNWQDLTCSDVSDIY